MNLQVVKGKMMKRLTHLCPSKPLKELRWFDIAVITLLMFGQFIYRSTELYLASFAPAASTGATETATNTASEGAAFSSNFNFQLLMLFLTILYLLLRRFDFKQLPIRMSWSVLLWTPLIFVVVGFFGDIVTTLSGEYNYFDPTLWSYVDLLEIFRKFAELTPMAILYGLLNGFYEEFFFLGLMTSVKDKYKWWALAYSTIIRISFHTYHAVGLGYRSSVRSLLLFPLQVQGQEPLAFLSHARLGGYVWLQFDVRSD